jgi:ABC-2 type transport system permease protein
MFGFISNFMSGSLVPIPLMPAAVQGALRWTFPYWAVFGPVQLLLGRASSADFVRGVLTLSAWLCVLQALALYTWRRGVLRYAGTGA